MQVAGYELRLDQVGQEFGPNYVGERALIRVTRRDGSLLCVAAPDRKLYAARAQTISGVAICPTALDDLYVVAGDKRVGADGAPAWLIRAYWNPWVRFIFAGPLLMALGGLVSLSDRRLRFAVTRRARAQPAVEPTPDSLPGPAPAPAPAAEPAE
jgi:cytochrome c-type biogenesis protein CcmF